MSTNKCNLEECTLPSSSINIKFLLELKKEVDELIKTTEAKLLLHDGKIAELCRYLKDNLCNSLKCMLLDMYNSGELDLIIKEVVQDSYVELTDRMDKFELNYAFSEGLYNDLKLVNGGEI